jgi:hypothetical protein
VDTRNASFETTLVEPAVIGIGGATDPAAPESAVTVAAGG